jgi:6-phosphogluconolactonase
MISVQMDKSIKVFPTPYELAEKFAEDLVRTINESAKKGNPVSVALSGGTTPELLFTLLGDHFSKSVPWEYVHFFWGDERCVIPDNMESNYGMTRRKLLDKIDIPSENIHRIIGENDPEKEASRYSMEIIDYTRKRDGLPFFDIILLGLGEDGHTASIFPGHLELFHTDNICEIATHPVTLQKRITISGKVINNADSVAFLVTGKRKAEIVQNVIRRSALAQNFPASYIVPLHGVLNWYIDKDAGMLL